MFQHVLLHGFVRPGAPEAAGLLHHQPAGGGAGAGRHAQGVEAGGQSGEVQFGG